MKAVPKMLITKVVQVMMKVQAMKMIQMTLVMIMMMAPFLLKDLEITMKAQGMTEKAQEMTMTILPLVHGQSKTMIPVNLDLNFKVFPLEMFACLQVYTVMTKIAARMLHVKIRLILLSALVTADMQLIMREATFVRISTSAMSRIMIIPRILMLLIVITKG